MKMFEFITKTWNPLGGKCEHNCMYCWAQGKKGIAVKYGMGKYEGNPRLIESELTKHFNEDDFVFVCDMCDLFGSWVPSELIQIILDRIAESEATFLLLTKNPKRYLDFMFSDNVVLGATIECNWDSGYGWVSNAPSPLFRLVAMEKVSYPRKFVSVEPIMDFEQAFPDAVIALNPWAVAVGYDNYGNKLSEPSLAKTMAFIERLESAGIKVYRKTLRERFLIGLLEVS